MNVTKNLPYYDVLAVGKQLQVTVSSGGHALVEGYIGSVKFISQTVTATTNFGVYFSPVNFKVSNLTGIVDAQEIQPLIGYNPASIAETGGTMSGVTINNCAIGQTTPAAVKTSNLAAVYTDSSGTAGNVTNNSPRGRAAFAAAGTSVVVTSTLVTATSTIQVSLGGTDATLTSVRVTPAAGSFTVTGNAAATAQTNFDFLVIN
jgi:hypothetical protein